MNLPNKLSVVRIILTILLIGLLLIPFHALGVEFPNLLINGVFVEVEYLIAGGIFIIGSITDFLDGHIARKYNLVTDTGKFLDPIADKALTNSCLIILGAKGFIPLIIPVIFVLRDIFVDTIRMEAARKGKVQAAGMSGKIKTATLMIGISLTFFYNMPFEFINIRVSDFFIYFATIMCVISGFEYYRANKTLLFSKNEEQI